MSDAKAALNDVTPNTIEESTYAYIVSFYTSRSLRPLARFIAQREHPGTDTVFSLEVKRLPAIYQLNSQPEASNISQRFPQN